MVVSALPETPAERALVVSVAIARLVTVALVTPAAVTLDVWAPDSDVLPTLTEIAPVVVLSRVTLPAVVKSIVAPASTPVMVPPAVPSTINVEISFFVESITTVALPVALSVSNPEIPVLVVLLMATPVTKVSVPSPPTIV
jgi:hypothetical protein